MPFCRRLSEKELQTLDEWLKTKEIQLDNRTLRELSNVVNVARLFRQLDPKLDMGNYSSNSSLSLKINNWERFNLKVFQKLGLRINRQELEHLAMGNLSAVRSLLFYLMCAESELPKSLPLFARSMSNSKPCKLCSSDYQQGYKAKICKKDVPYHKYELLTNLSRKKDTYLNSMNDKIQYLESLLLVKEDRIDYLIDRLAKLSK